MPKHDRTAALVADFLAAIRQAVLDDLQEDLARLRGPAKRQRGRTPNPNWPRCPTCGKPAFPHTRPYCREHGEARRKRQARTKAR